MESFLDRLNSYGLLSRVVLDDALRALLGGTKITASRAQGTVETGTCELGAVSASPLGIFDLRLSLPSPDLPFRLELGTGQPPQDFHLYFLLSEAAPAKSLFEFIDLPGYALAGATLRDEGGKQWLEPSGEQVELRGVGVSLLVRGSAGNAAESLVTPSGGGPDGIVQVEVHPPTVLVGGTGLGLDLSDGLTLDSSPTVAAPGTTVIDGKALPDHPEPWQGVITRRVRLFPPKDVPLIGGHPIETFLAIGDEPPGVDLALATRIPAEGGRPEIDVRIECRDPTARGGAGLLPTLVEASMTLPLSQQKTFDGDKSIRFLAGEPVVARMSFARDVTAWPPVTRVKLGVEAQGPRGILTIDAGAAGAGTGEKAAVAAGTLVTALIAGGTVHTDPAPGGGDTGVYLHLLLVAGIAMSAFLKQAGTVVLHAVELEGEGEGIDVKEKLKLKLDYSVAAVVDTFNVGVISVGMNENQPMRVRVRNVTLTIDTTRSGLEMFHLGHDKASIELEDPGNWIVHSPASLFDVLGTRSGRGSSWIEVDLRFAVDLGPLKVEGATIRATVDAAGIPSAELRGLAASLSIPGLIDGHGQVSMTETGILTALDVGVIPLNVGADCFVQVDPPLIALGLGIDLPGPIPLANSGLGIFGLGGAFAANGKPNVPADKPTLIENQLAWDYRTHGFTDAPGNVTIGVEAVLGTVPDLGFTFSAKGGLFLTVPDFAIRVGLAAKLISPRLEISYHPDPNEPGFHLQGVVVIDPADGVTIGVTGEYNLKPLLDVKVPLGAHFPVKTDDWFIYLGADGYPKQERALGPIQATLLPDLIGTGGSAFLMMRGHGIESFGRTKSPVTITDGFVLAFGFGFEYVLGVKGVIWAEVHASADILLATNPLVFAGFGSVGGSLNLGPVSLGIDAQIDFMLQAGQDPYLHAQVCGHVDLFFFDLEGCVEIEVGGKPQTKVPPPNEHPLERKEDDAVVANVALIDSTYRKVGPLAENPNTAATVWPDTLLHLSFASPPHLDPGVGGSQFPAVVSTYGARARSVGGDMLSYDWTLSKLELRDVTGDPHGAGTLVPGELSAAWLPGKNADAGTSVEPAELVLLTPRGDLWLRRTVDGGKGLAHDPLKRIGVSCVPEPPPEPGWTHGSSSVPNGPGSRRLVPARLSPDPTVSRLAGHGDARCSLVPAQLDSKSARLLPLGLDFDPDTVVAFPQELTLPGPEGDEGPFPGYLALGDVYTGVGENEGLYPVPWEMTQTWSVHLEDRIFEGRLWLLTGERDHVTVTDDTGRAWQHGAAKRLDADGVLVRFEPPHDDAVGAVTIKWRLAEEAGFVALGGVTGTARRAADERHGARVAVATQLATAKHNGPQTPGQAPSAAFPSVLEPGRTYRLDVDLSWAGTLTQRDGDGAESKTFDSGDRYTPPGGQPRECARSYWFCTAEREQPGDAANGGLMASVPKFGAADLFEFKHLTRDLFNPAMLERHLLGYEPGQAESCRFLADPLRAHFGVDHVARLADAYGYDLKLGLRRVDAPGGVDPPLSPILGVLLAPTLLDVVGRRWEQMAQSSPCELPLPGATLSATTGLSPEAWYELYVLAESRSGDHDLDGQLPGVTFRTSRWSTPGDMIDALGFARDGAGQPAGDLELLGGVPLEPPVMDGDDAAFEAALAGIGHDSLPPSATPRTSVLWQAAGDAWLLAGVLIESPEPIHRPGRLELQRVAFGTAVAESPQIVFDEQRLDRSGARVLALASRPQPIAVADPRLWVRLDDKLAGQPLVGRLELPQAPRFDGEPS